MIFKNVGTIIGTDGQKMSKSYKNTIELFASDEELKEGNNRNNNGFKRCER